MVENTLYARAPHLIAEWDYEKNTKDPNSICPNHGSKVWWKCKLGHT